MSIVYLDRGEIVSKADKPIKHCSCLDKYKGKIVELLEKGVQRKEIAQRFGVSKQTLFRFFKLNQIEHSLSYRLNASEAKIAEMFKQGITIKQMALCLKTSQKTIARKVKELKLLRSRSDTYNKQTILEKFHTPIKQMFEAGLSYLAIAETLGVHVQSIKNCVKQLGLKRNKPGKYASAIVGREDMLLKMHDAGIATKDIAVVFSCNPRVIRYHLRRLGIKMDTCGRTVSA